MENRKQFLAFNTGEDNKGRYAFHVEGNVARTPVFKAGANGKKGFCSFGIGVGRNPWLLLGDEVAKEQAANTHCNEKAPFVEVIVFDPICKTLENAITKGSKVVVSGRPEKQSYEKNGETVEYVRLIADNIYPLSCKATTGGKPNNTVTHVQQVYTKKDNTKGENNVVTLLGGTIKSVGDVREYNGRPVVSFDVDLSIEAKKMQAIVDGSYQKDADYGNYKTVRCSVWGNRALNLGKILVPGNTVAITGIPSKNTYNGNDYVNLTVQEFSVLNWDGSAAANANGASTANTAPVDEEPQTNAVGVVEEPAMLMDDEEDLDLPF